MNKRPARRHTPRPTPTYVTTLLGNGEICPISEMLGRRRLRRIAADSAEGRRLLRSGQVTVRTRQGRRFSGTSIVEVFDELARELRQAASDPGADPRAVEDLERALDALTRRRGDYG